MLGQQQRHKRIVNLLPATQKIRNVSIVAHVDHGKTTLADCLISSNGIIHKKQAGQLRLLDDRLDEQDRGITMKSSSIALFHRDHLINLIDSPGHLEFYTEVSAALRLTDSALLVVDVVEGVSSQTFRVLSQLYTQKLPAILILNKLDKLITHCKMEPLEAYNHISQIIEQVNAILGSFINKQVSIENINRKKSQDFPDKHIEQLENMFYFSAEKKNIIFGTALDNWGFSPESFAPLIAKKIGKEPQEITKYLWGDFFFNPKTKEFHDKPRNQNDKPICVDLVLKPIWDIYENVWSKNVEKVEKIIKTLNIKISENTKKNYNQQLIKQILSGWIPIDKVTMDKIVDVLPDPAKAQAFRLPYLLQLNTYKQHKVSPQISNALSKCDNSPQMPLIAFISKMVNIPKNSINEGGLNPLEGKGDTRAIGFGRIFSGTLKRGQDVLVISPKMKKALNQDGQVVEVPDIAKVRVQNLYIFNAQFPEGVSQAYAGNIIGFSSLEHALFKSGTISSIQDCISFAPVAASTKSILKVSVTTQNIEDSKKMMEGLQMLDKSDPSVDVYLSPTGDVILNTCGQVHLEKCIVDLETIYCKIPIKTSQPIINFRETIIWTNPNQNKNQKYIQQAEKKKQQELKRQLMEKYRSELLVDAQLDQLQKEKLKAIKEWDSHVEIYESEDLTVEDTRYFMKNRDDEEQEKYNYKKDKEDNRFRKIDHRNRGKLHIKQKFTNLNLKTNINMQWTPNQQVGIRIRALGLEFEVTEFLQKQNEKMKALFQAKKVKNKLKVIKQQTEQQQLDQQRKEFLDELVQKMEEFGVDPALRKSIIEKSVCFSHRFGPNILLINEIHKHRSMFYRYQVLQAEQKKPNQAQEESHFVFSNEINSKLEELKVSHAELLNSIILGFDLACNEGPLCNEPLMGTIFIVEEIKTKKKQIVKENISNTVQNEKTEQGVTKDKNQDGANKTQASQVVEQHKIIESEKQGEKQGEKQNVKGCQKDEHDPSESVKQVQLEQKSEQVQLITNKQQTKVQYINDVFGPLAGQIMGTMKDTCLEAFLGASPRLVEPMYLCELHTDQQYYGPVHNQLSRRRAKIIEQDLHEITNMFIIKAHLPIVESQKFCFQMLDKSQGTINAQLNFDTWKIYAEDPFFVPLTEEEIQENGLENTVPNSAKIMLEKIRMKKGLVGMEKIVSAAEKQRNLKKK